MSASDIELLQRVERLERQNRVLKAGGIVGLLLVAFLAAAPPKDVAYDVVRATRFEVVDDQGTQRGFLGMQGPTPMLRLGKAPSRVQVSIEAQDTQTDLSLTAPDTSSSSVDLNAHEGWSWGRGVESVTRLPRCLSSSGASE